MIMTLSVLYASPVKSLSSSILKQTIWFGFKSKHSDLKLLLCSVSIELTGSVHDLGVILDSELSMRQYVGKLLSICFFHLHCLHQFWWILDPLVAKTSQSMQLS